MRKILIPAAPDIAQFLAPALPLPLLLRLLQSWQGGVQPKQACACKTLLQKRQIRPLSAARIQHGLRLQAYQVQPLMHAGSNFTAQEIRLRNPLAAGKQAAHTLHIYRRALGRLRTGRIRNICHYFRQARLFINSNSLHAAQRSFQHEMKIKLPLTQTAAYTIYQIQLPSPPAMHPILQFMRRYWQHLESELLPCSCALCGQANPAAVCAACSAQYLPPPSGAHCVQCALPLSVSEDTVCGQCLQRLPSFDATVAACHYQAPLEQLVLGLKFQARLGLAEWMAARIRDALLAGSQAQAGLPDILCPVPLAPRRLAERGYNQALEIARPLARSLGVRLEARLCQRIRETRAQSLLPLNERGKNLRQAFVLAPQAFGRVDGLHIGVVDDVMTTGHTLQQVADLLKHHGAARVSNFVFARTLPHPS